MALELERSYLAEVNAKLVSYEDNELLHRRELKRNWPGEPDKLIEDALTYLNQYGSANNVVAQQFVTDPQANRQTFAGRWRIVANEKDSFDNESPGSITTARWSGITQTLRYGFAESLAWSEARLISSEVMAGNTSAVAGINDTTSDSPSDTMMIEWVNLNPATTKGLINAGILAGDSITDPIIRGVTYTGAWHKLVVSVGESELTDGSGRIRIVLARPQYTLNAYESTLTAFFGATQTDEVNYLWNVPRDLAQSIITAWKDDNHSASASLNSENSVNIVLRRFDPGATPIALGADVSGFACSSVSTTYYYWGVTDPTAAAYDIDNVTSFPNNATRGYSYNKQISFNREQATFNVEITEVHTIPRATLTNVVVDKSVRATATRTQTLGQGALPSALGAATIGTVERLGITVTDDCSVDTNKEVIASIPTTVLDNVIVEKAALQNVTRTTAVDQLTIPTAYTDPLAGQTKRLGATINADGSYDTLLETTTSVLRWEIVDIGTPDGISYEGKYQNWIGLTIPHEDPTPDEVYAATADGIKTHFLVQQSLNLLFYNVSMSHTMNVDGSIDAAISARPVPVTISGKPSSGTPGTFDWWEADLTTTSVKDSTLTGEDLDNVISHFQFIYSNYRVIYFSMEDYTETQLYAALNGAADLQITTSGGYWRAKFLIGRKYEGEYSVNKLVTEGVGDTDGCPTTGFTPIPPPP